MIRLESLQIEDYKIYQDSNLYCFTSDSILLSKFTSVKKNDIVADFCSGSGIVGLHLYALNPKINQVHLFEMQQCMHNLAVETIKVNKLENKFFAHNIKLQDIGVEFNGYFSLIVVNPPYGNLTNAPITNKNICKQEITINLEQIIYIASKKLKHGGRINMVHRADRLADIFYYMKKYGIEPKKMQFINSSGKKEIYLVMVEGVKGGKTGLKVLTDGTNNLTNIGE